MHSQAKEIGTINPLQSMCLVLLCTSFVKVHCVCAISSLAQTTRKSKKSDSFEGVHQACAAEWCV